MIAVDADEAAGGAGDVTIISCNGGDRERESGGGDAEADDNCADVSLLSVIGGDGDKSCMTV